MNCRETSIFQISQHTTHGCLNSGSNSTFQTLAPPFIVYLSGHRDLLFLIILSFIPLQNEHPRTTGKDPDFLLNAKRDTEFLNFCFSDLFLPTLQNRLNGNKNEGGETPLTMSTHDDQVGTRDRGERNLFQIYFIDLSQVSSQVLFLSSTLEELCKLCLQKSDESFQESDTLHMKYYISQPKDAIQWKDAS